jgi:hypothetical protein
MEFPAGRGIGYTFIAVQSDAFHPYDFCFGKENREISLEVQQGKGIGVLVVQNKRWQRQYIALQLCGSTAIC